MSNGGIKITKLSRITTLEPDNDIFVTGRLGDNQTYGATFQTIANNIVPLVSVGIVGGSDMQVQYNKNGVFTADSNFVWDYSNQILTISGQVNATTLNGVALTNG
ncbi:hypothetical protein KAR91_66540, partial [Candidatus Pacearchaeota archaeon]|nr:hypothetical protein [Candidatus Pacearchaeota archaeon]